MISVAFLTLGCKVNQYETEAMTEQFKAKGYQIKDFGEVCDIYVINTCTVTGTGDKKSRQTVRRAHTLNPNAVIVVAGCYSQVSPDEVKKIEGVNLVLGTSERAHIADIVEKYMAGGDTKILEQVTDIMKQKDYEQMNITQYSGKTRAFVKIEDGCTEFCSYCIIPYARGPVRSRKKESILKEITSLAQNGFKEIVLTGINLAAYGRDLKDISLADITELAANVDGIERIRFGSVEPRLLTEEFVQRISKIPQMCNHFHISLQSGCDETLKRMNRKYTTDEYAHCTELIRKYFENPAFTTDIMVGFPGETDEEFEKSLEFMKKIKFAEAHVFAYSRRKGTKADKMPNQIDKKTKEVRSHKMAQVCNELKYNYMNSLVGKEYDVLFERKIQDGIFEGHMTNYVKIHAPSDADISHTIKRVAITGVSNGACTGILV